jgi:UDPglucose 6-dehydrogenase
MKLCVQGLWHLGCVTAACLASKGHDVTGLDFGAATVGQLRQGIPPLFEPGLEDLVKREIAAGRLAFTADAQAAVKGIEVLWVAYDTPVDDDDQSDVEFVVAQIEQTLPHLPQEVTIVISSQMPVGSVRRLETLAQERFADKKLSFACSPENLRLGQALKAFLQPDRIVIGIRSARDQDRLTRLFSPITAPIEWMRVESAEMTKHAVNAFLAASVTFANEIASICERVGADAKEVERGLKTDARIGPKAYLSPGGAFAGGTLARDIAFLNHAAGKNRLATPLVSAIKASNDEHKQWATRRLRLLFPDLPRLTVAMWGLTYKPGTDTLRRSMAIELGDWLIGHGVTVRVHDPAARAMPPRWEGKAVKFDDAVDALAGAQALVIATGWPQYREVPVERIAAAAPGLTVLDANRFLAGIAGIAGIRYIAVGTPE